MEPVIIGVVVGILVVGGFLIYTARRSTRTDIQKSPSSENLADMVAQEDPTQESV